MRRAPDESLRVSAEGGKKRLLTRREDVFGLAVVDHCRRHQADPRVAMLVVVGVVAVGCAAEPVVWSNPNANQQQFNVDKFECLSGARSTVVVPAAPAPPPPPAGATGFSAGLAQGLAAGSSLRGPRVQTYTDEYLYSACMNARGYVAVTE